MGVIRRLHARWLTTALAVSPPGTGTYASSAVTSVVTFDETDDPPAKSGTFTITARQPGSNFIVAASGRMATLDQFIFDDDANTLISPLHGTPLPQHVRTETLTVWRTLHVEEDSMRDPPDGEPFGEGIGVDDEHPGGLGTEGGVGNFVQPSLAWMTTQMSRAHIKVVSLTEAAGDTRDGGAFVHNLVDSDGPGESRRDVRTASHFWTVQVFAA